MALVIPQNVRAYDFSYTYQGQTLYYRIVNGEARVTYQNYYSSNDNSPRYSNLSGTLVIPSNVTCFSTSPSTTYSVTSIDADAFRNCSGLTSVTFPNSVTSIGSNAFWGCSGLTSVTISYSVTSIGSDAFRNCSGLTSVTIPNSVTSIGWIAFYVCSGLTSVTIPNSVTYIQSQTFQGCSGLTSVTIPNSVTSIGQTAFYNCSGLTSVTIPNSVTAIGQSAFAGCNSIHLLTYNCPDNLLGSINKTNLQTVVIGDSVVSISSQLFQNCTNLTSVTIGDSITSIGNQAFSGCSGLTSIVVSNGNTHYDSRNNCNAIIVTSTNTLIVGCQNTVIPNSVTSIGWRAFYGCSGLTSVTIPNSVTSIGQYAFSGCSGLTSVTIGNSVTSIGNYAFYNCSGLTEITSLAVVAPSLGNYAFYNMPDSIPVYIPCSSTASYQQSTWNYFSNFIESSASNIDVQTANTTMGAATIMTRPTCFDSTAVITATANYGYHFTQWNDGNTQNPRTITLTQDTTFTALFDRNQYSVTGVANNSTRGTVTGSDTVYYLDTVTLEAVAIDGYYFQKWNDNNTANPRQIVATGNITKTAIFNPNQYSITLSVDTSIHGSCSGGGNYNYLSNRTITATANYGYHFTQWNDGNTQNPRTITLTQDTTFTAMFAKNIYIVTVVSNDNTRGTVAGNDTVEYLDSITISATANYYYHFTRWQDNNTDNPRRVQVTQNKTYTAYFDFNQYSITLDVDTNIHGAVYGGGSYNYLSNRTIIATPNYGYHFTQWSDGDTNNPRVLTLTQDTAFTALFAKNTYTITAIPNDTIRGIVIGSTLTEYLDSVTIVAIPNYGYHFTVWSDGDTTNPRTIEATRDSLITAYFNYNQYSIILRVDTNIHGSVAGGGLYNYLSEQTINAIANHGYHFTTWNDGDTTNPRTITLTQDTVFTAIFAKNTYTLTGLSADTIRGSVSGSTTMEYLDSVSIAATANYGYHFLYWNDGDTTNPRIITLIQDTVLTAYFAKNWYSVIGTSDNETMGYVTGSDTVEYFDNVSLSATSNYGYHFSSWSDGDTNNPREVRITQDTIFVALFAKNQYILTVQSNDETHGNVSDGGVFDYLDTVIINASANDHYHFVRWDDGNTENPRDYIIVGDATLTAIFAIDTHTVIVASNDIARGMVEATGTEFVYGTPCTVTATVYTGYMFSRWSNGITANPYTFAVLEDTELMAIFEEEGTQGIDDVATTDNIRIFSKYDRILIDGLNSQDVTIYTIDGRTIASLSKATEHIAIPVSMPGVYFVKVGEHPARKVVVIR